MMNSFDGTIWIGCLMSLCVGCASNDAENAGNREAGIGADDAPSRTDVANGSDGEPMDGWSRDERGRPDGKVRTDAPPDAVDARVTNDAGDAGDGGDARDAPESCPSVGMDASVVYVPKFTVEAADGSRHTLDDDPSSMMGRATYSIIHEGGIERYHVLEYFGDLLVVYNDAENPRHACQFGLFSLVLDDDRLGDGSRFCSLSTNESTREDAVAQRSSLDKDDLELGCKGGPWISLGTLAWYPDAGSGTD